MQCLSAPTRDEIDRAHQRQRWLDIGVPSIRNLRAMSWYRISLWFLLASSSIPLHLFYNSAVFSTLSAREYSVLAVSPNLANGSYFNETAKTDDFSNFQSYGAQLLDEVRNRSIWEPLENSQCIKKYAQEFLADRGDVLAVTSDLNNSLSMERLADAHPSSGVGSGLAYDWICDVYPSSQIQEQCRPDDGTAKDWTLGSGLYSVSYCLSRRMEEHCRLQYSLPLLITVIVCNFVKAIGMILLAYQRTSKPLVTLGDALTSFLDNPDPTSKGNCMADKTILKLHSWGVRTKAGHTTPRMWFKNASKTRWFICNIM
ncbi:MAG: hypothetical protein Q9220_006954 [cf. Caloplaca sp. 1 TL-2023]